MLMYERIKMKDIKLLENKKLANVKELEHFINLLEKTSSKKGPDKDVWNKRADIWKDQDKKRQKDNYRLKSTLTYMKDMNLLQEDYSKADVGCGQGKFACEFAKKVNKVVGFDLAENMIGQARDYAKKENLSNVDFKVCDFKNMDIENKGYKNAFDLAFSSMTPAVKDLDSLMKFMDLSKKYCLNISHVSYKNFLHEQMVKDLGLKAKESKWTGIWFYSLFNILFLLGYNPQTSFDQKDREILIKPDQDYIDLVLEHRFDKNERTRENAKKVKKWLKNQANEDGMVREITSTTYGRILWKVDKKTQRIEF